MEEKKAIIIFNTIAVFILLLIIALKIIFLIEYTKEHCSEELKEDIRHYMYEHNLRDEDYTFHEIFWSSTESESFSIGIGRGITMLALLILDALYVILSIIGLIFYMTHLC